VWLGLVIGSRTDQCIVWITDVKQVQYLELWENHSLHALSSPLPFNCISLYWCKLAYGTFSYSMACSFWYTLHNKVTESLVNNELEWMSQKCLWPYFRSWRKPLKISVRFASFQTGITQLWSRVVNQLPLVLVAICSKSEWCI
jgi:hypothetical protein